MIRGIAVMLALLIMLAIGAGLVTEKYTGYGTMITTRAWWLAPISAAVLVYALTGNFIATLLAIIIVGLLL